MRRDHRPYPLKRLHRVLERQWVEARIRPQLDALGPHYKIMRPWHLRLHGAGIRFGRCVHVVCAPHRKVVLTSWSYGDHQGLIEIGDYALLCPGVRIDSASIVQVGSNCMIASGAYLTDADWHDLYDRTRPVGATAPIILGDNVWVGDGAIVCKGVTLGRNSVVGAGSVVVDDVPSDTVVAGNPARAVKVLESGRPLRRRQDLLADPEALDREMDAVDRMVHGDNGWLHWLRSRILPRRGD